MAQVIKRHLLYEETDTQRSNFLLPNEIDWAFSGTKKSK